MKILTLNFLSCSAKECRAQPAAFPLHPADATLVSNEVELNKTLLINLLPRLDWDALKMTSTELGLIGSLPENPPTAEELQVSEGDELVQKLHAHLMETEIEEGKLVCANCRHEYAVKEGIANFLLPAHKV